MSLVAVGAVTAAAILTVHAQQQPFRAGVNFVRVDAIVTDRSGAFVSDLAASDFEVRELGKPQKIETFQRLLLDGGLMAPSEPVSPIRNEDDERREAARADVRLFGIFLDEYHVSREASLQTRDIIASFIRNDLGPSDLVELMTPLTPLASVLLTRNHESIESQIEQFLGRKGDYEPPRNVPEENVIRRYGDNPAMIEMIRNQVSFSALDGFITHLAGYKETRKTLVLVTEGFAGGLRDSPGATGGLYLGDLYTDANRGNVSVYWIDPRRLSALAPVGEWRWDDRCGCLTWKPGAVSIRSVTLQRDPLSALALYTDGRTLITNDLLASMKDIVRDMSGYYLLGYNSSLDAADGKFHEISVRVKRPGVSVRARKGYWAYTKSEVAAATAPPPPRVAPEIRAAIDAALADDRNGDARTWIGFERGTAGRTKVSIAWDPDVPPAGSVQNSAAALDVTASGDGGTLYFRGRISTMTSFDAPPGPMALRLSVERPGGESEVETKSVAVPDFTSDRTLATPQVFRSLSPAGLRPVNTPSGPRPTAVRVFARTDHVLVRIPASDTMQSLPRFTARLLNVSGEPLRDVTLTSRDGGLECELPLASLAAAAYVLEVAGPPSAPTALVAFRVTNR